VACCHKCDVVINLPFCGCCCNADIPLTFQVAHAGCHRVVQPAFSDDDGHIPRALQIAPAEPAPGILRAGHGMVLVQPQHIPCDHRPAHTFVRRPDGWRVLDPPIARPTDAEIEHHTVKTGFVQLVEEDLVVKRGLLRWLGAPHLGFVQACPQQLIRARPVAVACDGPERVHNETGVLFGNCDRRRVIRESTPAIVFRQRVVPHDHSTFGVDIFERCIQAGDVVVGTDDQLNVQRTPLGQPSVVFLRWPCALPVTAQLARHNPLLASRGVRVRRAQWVVAMERETSPARLPGTQRVAHHRE